MFLGFSIVAYHALVFCGHVQTRETGSKVQTGSKPPLEVVWLDANRMRIDPECALCVDARMRIEAN